MTKTELPIERIASKIYLIRGMKVMLDRDLSELYGVETRVLKQAVRRNIDRFPNDFMFELNKAEFENWRSQFVTSNSDKIGLRYSPMVFTEQGIAMLSSVLKSQRSITVNIQIMRTFVQLRKITESHSKLANKLDEIEKRIEGHDEQFQAVFEVIKRIMATEEKPTKKIGFTVKEKQKKYRKRAKKIKIK
jgi:ORF6N domain